MLKKLIKLCILNIFAIYIVSYFIPALSFSNNPKILLMAGGILALSNFFIKPIIKIIMLPLNLVTFGLFSWVSGVFTLYLTSYLISEFNIFAFDFPGISFQGFIVPAYSFGIISSVVLISLILNLLVFVLSWVFDV